MLDGSKPYNFLIREGSGRKWRTEERDYSKSYFSVPYTKPTSISEGGSDGFFIGFACKPDEVNEQLEKLCQSYLKSYEEAIIELQGKVKWIKSLKSPIKINE